MASSSTIFILAFLVIAMVIGAILLMRGSKPESEPSLPPFDETPSTPMLTRPSIITADSDGVISVEETSVETFATGLDTREKINAYCEQNPDWCQTLTFEGRDDVIVRKNPRYQLFPSPIDPFDIPDSMHNWISCVNEDGTVKNVCTMVDIASKDHMHAFLTELRESVKRNDTIAIQKSRMGRYLREFRIVSLKPLVVVHRRYDIPGIEEIAIRRMTRLDEKGITVEPWLAMLAVMVEAKITHKPIPEIDETVDFSYEFGDGERALLDYAPFFAFYDPESAIVRDDEKYHGRPVPPGDHHKDKKEYEGKPVPPGFRDDKGFYEGKPVPPSDHRDKLREELQKGRDEIVRIEPIISPSERERLEKERQKRKEELLQVKVTPAHQ